MKKRHDNDLPDINDPSQLYSYVKVINPKMWLLLLSCFIVGLGSFLSFAMLKLTNGLHCTAVCKDQIMTVFVGEDNLDRLEDGMSVYVNGAEYYVSDIRESRDEELGEYYMYIINSSDIEHGENIYCFSFNAQMEDGVYDALIEEGSSTPLSYVIGGEM